MKKAELLQLISEIYDENKGEFRKFGDKFKTQNNLLDSSYIRALRAVALAAKHDDTELNREAVLACFDRKPTEYGHAAYEVYKQILTHYELPIPEAVAKPSFMDRYFANSQMTFYRPSVMLSEPNDEREQHEVKQYKELTKPFEPFNVYPPLGQ